MSCVEVDSLRHSINKIDKAAPGLSPAHLPPVGVFLVDHVKNVPPGEGQAGLPAGDEVVCGRVVFEVWLQEHLWDGTVNIDNVTMNTLEIWNLEMMLIFLNRTASDACLYVYMYVYMYIQCSA